MGVAARVARHLCLTDGVVSVCSDVSDKMLMKGSVTSDCHTVRVVGVGSELTTCWCEHSSDAQFTYP